ncbi:MAG: prolipoprotein diacylglyceryl transferase, partial [Clostridia bacterium]|nr:prolipoprotein diacylglyceryl transferase [Clostridia bacterium]
FTFFGGNNIVRVFVWVPVFAYPAAKLLKIDWRRGCDFISPCVCINHGIAHLGCIFAGCCYSYPMENGVFNPTLSGGTEIVKTFPIQPIEAIVALIIAFYIARREWKKNYKTDGLSIPIMLMLFGYSRFFLEFARDNNKVLFGISDLAIHALICGIMGTVMYFILRKKSGNSDEDAASADKLCLRAILLVEAAFEPVFIVLKQAKIKPEIIAALVIGTVLMFGIMLLCRMWHKEISITKLVFAAPLLTLSGTFGAYLMFYVENGKWGGISFYGSVFVIPVLFLAVAFGLGVKYGNLIDISAPSVCIMLAINKINCIRTGCCKGMALSTDEQGNVTRFPSQIVELCTVLIIMAVLIFIIKKGKLKGLIYPLFMIVYGTTRFGLNLLREVNEPFKLGLSAGCFWSVIAVIIGAIWIAAYFIAQKKKKA